MNTKSKLPKLIIAMIANLADVPVGYTQETSLNGKYLKGIPTAVTEPDVDIGNSTHTHASEGDHTHPASAPAHTHGGSHSVGASVIATGTTGMADSASVGHTHIVSTNSLGDGQSASNGDHTHDAKSNDLEHRTITFYKQNDNITHMSRSSLPRNLMFFFSKTALPAGILEDISYRDKHIKGDATPATNSGSNLHQHDNQTHNHDLDITAHDHTVDFSASQGPDVDKGNQAQSDTGRAGHLHSTGNPVSGAKTSTPVASGLDSGHQHDNLNHEPSFNTLKLIRVNVLKMSNVGVPKDVIGIWLAALSLIPNGWQISDGTNNTETMLDVYPKGAETPSVTGGLDTHTHSLDSVSHAHSGASVSHSHNSPTGVTGAATNNLARTGPSGNAVSAASHAHGISSITGGSPQTVTVTNQPSNHDHDSISNDPDSKTVGFIERIT